MGSPNLGREISGKEKATFSNAAVKRESLGGGGTAMTGLVRVLQWGSCKSRIPVGEGANGQWKWGLVLWAVSPESHSPRPGSSEWRWFVGKCPGNTNERGRKAGLGSRRI